MTLEQQLEQLASCGIVLAPGITVNDLLEYYDREHYESEPFESLVATMGMDTETDPPTPMCERLWLVDYECTQEGVTYADVIDRLQLLSGRVLPITNVTDECDQGGATDHWPRWMEFDLDGKRTRWELEDLGGWLDHDVLLRYNRLLRTYNTGLSLYHSGVTYGQGALLACLRLEEGQRLASILPFEFRPIT